MLGTRCEKKKVRLKCITNFNPSRYRMIKKHLNFVVSCKPDFDNVNRFFFFISFTCQRSLNWDIDRQNGSIAVWTLETDWYGFYANFILNQTPLKWTRVQYSQNSSISTKKKNTNESRISNSKFWICNKNECSLLSCFGCRLSVVVCCHGKANACSMVIHFFY